MTSAPKAEEITESLSALMDEKEAAFVQSRCTEVKVDQHQNWSVEKSKFILEERSADAQACLATILAAKAFYAWLSPKKDQPIPNYLSPASRYENHMGYPSSQCDLDTVLAGATNREPPASCWHW